MSVNSNASLYFWAFIKASRWLITIGRPTCT